MSFGFLSMKTSRASLRSSGNHCLSAFALNVIRWLLGRNFPSASYTIHWLPLHHWNLCCPRDQSGGPQPGQGGARMSCRERGPHENGLREVVSPVPLILRRTVWVPHKMWIFAMESHLKERGITKRKLEGGYETSLGQEEMIRNCLNGWSNLEVTLLHCFL